MSDTNETVSYTHDSVDALADLLMQILGIAPVARGNVDTDAVREAFASFDDKIIVALQEIGVHIVCTGDPQAGSHEPPYCAVTAAMSDDDPNSAIVMMHVITADGWTYIGRKLSGDDLMLDSAITALLAVIDTPADREVNLDA